MGLDFIRRASKGFTKAWDGGRVRLAQPTLFSRQFETRRRTVIIDLEAGCDTRVGAELTVCSSVSGLVLVRETDQIGSAKSAPADLVAAVQSVGGCALGLVTRVNPMSGTVEVQLD